MRISPGKSRGSGTSPSAPVEAEAGTDSTRPDPTADRPWRWAVIHFPCLEPVTPRGEIVMVSDKMHLPEARRKFPDLVVWHERELALFGEHMDSAGLDERAFVIVNRLKLKTRGWYMGIEREGPRVSGVATGGSE